MAEYTLAPFPRFGSPTGAGYKLYTYDAGTLDEALVFSDDSGTEHQNPVVANGDGLFDAIYLEVGASYKFILKTAADATVWTQDGIEAVAVPEEGTWTPVLTAATPGNLAVTYSAQLGRYRKAGSQVTVWGTISTSAFTHTTASGEVRISGLPFPAFTLVGFGQVGSLVFQGITKANYTQFTPEIESAQSYIRINASGQGQMNAALAITEMPTGGTVLLRFSVTYRTP